jgi:hypothetical protein
MIRKFDDSRKYYSLFLRYPVAYFLYSELLLSCGDGQWATKPDHFSMAQFTSEIL